ILTVTLLKRKRLQKLKIKLKPLSLRSEAAVNLLKFLFLPLTTPNTVMKKTFFIVLYITFASAAYAQTNTPEAKAAFKRFLDFYAQNNADSIFMLFSEDTQNILPLNKTRQFISQMHSQLGSIIKSEYSAASADYNVYKSYFEKPGYALFLNFDQNNKIIGLFLKPEEDIKTTDTLLSPDNISLKTEYGTLYGTLTLPDTTAKIPVVLIIGGSGPTDRNNNSSLGLKTNAFLMLAEALRSNGIAVLRYDKQGAGKSRSSKKESELRFSDFVNDASRFIDLLN